MLDLASSLSQIPETRREAPSAGYEYVKGWYFIDDATASFHGVDLGRPVHLNENPKIVLSPFPLAACSRGEGNVANGWRGRVRAQATGGGILTFRQRNLRADDVADERGVSRFAGPGPR